MSPSSVPPQVPSSGRPLPIRRVPWGRFPDLTGTISRLRLLASLRASLRFLRSALPPLRPSSLPRGGTTPRGPGLLLPRRPRRLSSVEKTRPPRFLDNPCVHAPLSDPGGPPTPGHYSAGDGVFRTGYYVDSTMMVISGLNHAACTLPVYASRPRSPQDAQHSVPAGGPALAGQDSHLRGRTEGFCHVYPSTWHPPSPSFAWRTTGRPPRYGLLSKPGRGFCQDVPFFAQAPNLPTQPTQLLSLRSARPIPATPLVTVGLHDPVADHLCGRLELSGQLLRTASGSNQLNHLTPQGRRVRRSCSVYLRQTSKASFGMVDTSFPNGQVSTKSGQVQGGTVVGAEIPANAPIHHYTTRFHGNSDGPNVQSWRFCGRFRAWREFLLSARSG